MSPSAESQRKLFGTDGIRGVAGAFPLDPETTFAIGCALGRHISHRRAQTRVVIGQDTRESSESIANSVSWRRKAWKYRVPG